MSELLNTPNTVELAADIVSAFVSNNSVPVAELPALIGSIHAALTSVATGATEQPAEEPKAPAVPIKKSVQPDYIVCLDDGKRFKSLKRHLRDSVGIFVCGSGGCSCSGQGSCEALAEEDGELSFGHTPLTRWHGPLFFRPVQDQEQQLQSCLVGWEMAPGPDRASEFRVQGLDGIGRVQQPAHLGREGIERHHLAPSPSPARGNGRVFGAPGAVLESCQSGLSGCRVHGPVDSFSAAATALRSL